MQQNDVTSPKDQSGFASGFLLGLVLGGAGGYFLTTKEGRNLLKSLTEDAGTKLDELKDNEIVQNLLAKLQELPRLEEIQETVEQVAPKKLPPLKKLFHSGGSPLKE